jgi:hypothetical protein
MSDDNIIDLEEVQERRSELECDIADARTFARIAQSSHTPLGEMRGSVMTDTPETLQPIARPRDELRGSQSSRRARLRPRPTSTMIFRSDKSATVPSSTKAHNRQLDQQIVDREAIDRDAPWWQRKFFATAYSTVASVVRRRFQ